MKGNDDKHIAVRGKMRQVEYAVLDDGTMPADDFIEKLDNEHDGARTDILTRFRHVADNGEYGISDQIFKHERDEIWTFKYRVSKKLIRLPCFRINNRWIITHGFPKIPSKPRWPSRAFKRANQIRDLILARENTN